MNHDKTDTQLEADLPLELPEEDSLHRAEFCEALAETLANRNGGDSLAVGITGNWGTGKSTIQNFVKHYLRQKDPKPVVIEFNPWEWSGQGKLLEAFLWSLSEALGKPDISGRHTKLGKRLKLYSAALQVGGAITSVWSKVISAAGIAAVGLGVWAGLGPGWLNAILGGALLVAIALPAVFEKLNSFIDAHLDLSRKSIDDLREEIGKDLMKVESPIIVFIDDVDRLSKEEIKLLFQLVRANLRFKNLTFVLLFQRSIVASALDELTTGNGSDYIGKIIQVEFDVPKASTKDMQGLLFKTLERVIFGEEKKPHFDKDRWANLFHDHLWHYFRSLRDIKRFSSSFEFYYRRHLNQGVLEVDTIDLIAIEVLRIFDNEAYRKLSHSLFIGKRTMMELLYASEKEREEQFNLQLDESTTHLEEGNQREQLKGLLVALFPQAGTGSLPEEAQAQWHLRARICDEKSFHRYFELSLDSSQATQKDLDVLMSHAGDRSRTVELFKDSIVKDTIEGLLQLTFTARLDIPLQHMQPLITAMFDIGDELPDQKQGWFGMSCTLICNRIVYHRLQEVDVQTTTDLLLKCHKETTGLILPLHHLAGEDAGECDKERASERDFRISKDSLPSFYKVNLDRIRAKAKDLSFLDHKECSYALYFWAEWSGNNEAQEWIKETIQDPKNALKLLVNFLGETRSTSGSGEEEIEPTLGAKAVEQLVDLEDLLKSASMNPESDRTEKEHKALELLDTAVKKKAAGESYERIRPRGTNFY